MLTVPEVCARLGLSKYIVYRMIHEGKLPALRFDTGRHKYMVEEFTVEKLEQTEDYFATPTNEHDGPVLLTAAEVAAILRCSVETVRRLATAGDLPAIRNPGRNSHWRFDRAQVLAYLKSRPMTAAPAAS